MLGVASVRLNISDIELLLHFQIRRDRGGIFAELPSFIIDGRRVATVILPPELSVAIGREVIQAWRAG